MTSTIGQGMTVRINRNVKRFRNLHEGEPCIILGNGPSLSMVDLGAIRCVTIGTNSSWMVHDSTYHCATDDWQLEHYAEHHDINQWVNLFTANVDYESFGIPSPKRCVRVNVLDHNGEANWSDDLEEGMYVCVTIIWCALQIAKWMGCDPIGLIGFDLCAYGFHSKFFKHPKANAPFFSEAAPNQNELMVWLRKRLKDKPRIVNLSPISKCTAFDKERFEDWT